MSLRCPSRSPKLGTVFVCFIAFLLFFGTLGAVCEEDIAAARELALGKLGKPLASMRVKELQALLTERGVDCRACTEREHVIERVMETIHLPVKVAPETPENSAEPTANIEELLRNLKNSPGGEGLNFQTFDRSRIEEMMKQLEKERASKEEQVHTDL